MELTVTETARQLGLTPRRVRALIERGQLPARRRGPIWVTTVDAVETYRRTAPGRGRPERPATAWKRLRAIAAHDRPPALDDMLPALRARSRRTRVALPAPLRDRLTPLPGTMFGGARLAGTTAVDGVVDLYAPTPVFERLSALLALEPDPAGGLVLHQVELPELPELTAREQLVVAWCDLADRADPAGDVAVEALWPGTIRAERLADIDTDGRVPYPALRAVVDWTNRHPRVAHLAVVDPPAPTGDAGIDSLLAGIAEAIADDHGFDRPAWTSDVPPAPLVASGLVADGDDRNGDVPEAFAARGLGFERATFWRR